MGWLIAISSTLVLVAISLLDGIQKRRVRRRFMAEREPLSDSAFCELVCRESPADEP